MGSILRGTPLSAASGSAIFRAKSYSKVVPSAAGLVDVVSSMGLLGPVAFAKTGGDANLSVHSITGEITATTAIPTGVSQSILVNAIGADGVVLPVAAALVGAVVVVTTWDIGLDRTPSYVPSWVRPATLAEGISLGSIPMGAIDFATGNNGGPFPDLWSWIDACNAANANGAINQDILITTASSSVPKRYLNVGLYGYGAAMPKIRWSGRTNDTPGKKSLFYVDKRAVTIRGIEFVDWNCVLAVGNKTTPLLDTSGVVDPNPYHTGNSAVTYTCDPVLGNAAGYGCNRYASLTLPANSFSVSSLSVRRQIANTTYLGENNGQAMNSYYNADSAWNAVLETVDIFTGQTCTDAPSLVSAINANTANHGYAAEALSGTNVILKPATVDTQTFSEVVIGQTGSPLNVEVTTPPVTITHCKFTDCNMAYAALLDVTGLGAVEFHKNQLEGTWAGLALSVSRWHHVRAANNEQWDCLTARTRTQTGRDPTTKAAMPSGSTTEFNTCFMIGIDKPTMMRYAVGGTTCLIENNYAHDCESYSASSGGGINTCVFVDLRNCWTRAANGRFNRVAYNKAISYKGIRGGEDSNWGYFKPRGLDIIGNYIRDCGARWYGTGTNDGSETTAILCKEPGSWNKPYTSAYGNLEPSEPLRIRGNSMVDQPPGIAVLKVDNCYTELFIEDNLVSNWFNYRNGVEMTSTTAGVFRILGAFRKATVRRNRFQKVDIGPTAPDLLINFHNITNAMNVTFTAAHFDLAGNSILNDDSAHAYGTYRVYTVDTNSIRINTGGNGAAAGFAASLITGANSVLSGAGVDTGVRMKVLHFNRSESSKGTNTVASAGHGSVDYLSAYLANT